jgi:hypothetical protein
MAMKRNLVIAALVAGNAEADTQKANPIRKVVTMLQKIQKKVEVEGQKEEAMFDKYMCYCKTTSADLTGSIDAATTKIPQVASSIETAEGQKVQLDSDLVKAKADREAAKAAIAEATALRKKEAVAYMGVKAEADANIGAVTKAVASLEGGASAAFLQTDAASTLRNFVQSKDMTDSERVEVMAFLSTDDQDDSEGPMSGEITGILKGLGKKMRDDLAAETATEEASSSDFEAIKAAKNKEVEAATSAIEDKTTRSGETAVSIVNMKEDLSDTEAAKVEDVKFKADLEKNCAAKQKEWDAIVASRADELVALSETIKLLNDDEALELFKKTLPSASSSFVQLKLTSSLLRDRVLAQIHAVQKSEKPSHPHLDFIAMALHGRAVDFSKVVTMIDHMVDVLKREGKADDDKVEYCTKAFDILDDKKKVFKLAISDSEKAIADAQEAVETLTGEIAALQEAIQELDKSVASATEQREAQHAEVTELLANNGAAKELIGFAKNRLNKFYSPKLYKAPPKRELSREDRIAVNMGGTAPPTPAPGGIGGTGITTLVQVSSHTHRSMSSAPPAPGPFKKKGEESSGVIAMMDLLIADLDKENQVAETEEKEAQADYVRMSSDAKSKRAADSSSLSEKSGAKADAEEALQNHGDDKKAATSSLAAVNQVTIAAHAECDWLLQYHDMRTEARNDELDSLSKAKAVLSGADLSLLQSSRGVSLRIGA